MASTTPDNILSPDAGDQYALVQDLGILADSVQDALTLRANAYQGTASERAAFTIATDGMLWQDTDGIKMIWRRDTGAWVPAVWQWSGTTTQMNAFTSAPEGFVWSNTTNETEYLRTGGDWQVLSSTTREGSFTPGSGWTNLTSSIWAGLKVYISGNVVNISGALTKTSFAALETAATLPVGLRPATSAPITAYTSAPTYAIVRPTGEIQPATSGSGQLTLGGLFLLPKI